MSIKQMSAVWDRAHTDDPSTLLVMLALADWANDEGICWPAIATIAEKCRISERQAQRIIKSLEEVGALEIVRKSGRKNTNIYKLKVPDSHHLFKEKVTFETEKVTFGAIKGDIAMSPEPPITINKKQPPKAKAEFVLPDWVPEEPWIGWLEMRSRKGCGATDRAKRLAVTELEKLRDQGQDPGKVLDNCTLRSWQGIFPLGVANGNNTGVNGNGAHVGQKEKADPNCPDCQGTGWKPVNSPGKATRVTHCECRQKNAANSSIDGCGAEPTSAGIRRASGKDAAAGND